MKKILLLGLLSVSITLSIHGQTKRQDIIKLLDITDTKLEAAQMFDLMLPNLKAAMPDVPLTFWVMFKLKLDIDSFVDAFIPLYDKYFSHDDIKQLIKFYESPIGKKLLAVTPLITKESYSLGEEWGEQLALDILEELFSKGYY
jgi:hypothetical protein